MGKLKELWDEYKTLDVDDITRRIQLQNDINKCESWMIEKGYKKDGITKWHNNKSIVSDSYPHGSGAVFIEDLDQLKEIQQ